MAVTKEVVAQKEYIIGLRRYFHQYPELSGEEYRTALKIEEELTKLHIPFERVGQTGIIATIENNESDLRRDTVAASVHKENQNKKGLLHTGDIVLRADIDALKISEKNEVPYKSQNPGVMHACGHDGHIAILLGAAKVIAARRKQLTRKVVLIFQPAEEIGAGAKLFLEREELNNAQCILGIHLASFFSSGEVIIAERESNASCDYFKIIVKGRSCHVSKPQDGIDALYIGSQIVNSLQSIAARLTSPLEPVVVGIGRMEAGTSYNIVAQEAVLEGTTRAFNHETRAKVNALVIQIAQSIGSTYGADIEVQFKDYASPLINDTDVAHHIAELAKEIVGESHVVTQPPKNMMADDFAEYLNRKKGSYIFVGSAHNEATSYPHHHERFDIDEEALLVGADLFVRAALENASSK